MIDAPLGFAFTAGLVATVNPCGFAMLPAYLSYYMGLEGDEAAGDAGVGRGLLVGGVVSAGFLLVFGVVGALFTVGIRSVIDYVPWVALVVGILLVILGLAMLLLGYQPTVSLPKLQRGGGGRGHGAVFLFGVSYAVASLSCGLPIFLAVVGTATATADVASSILTFVTFGVGMSMLLVALTVAMALARDGMLRWLRSAMRHVTRISGAVLVVAGAYITAYWVVNLQDPLAARGRTFQVVERVQTWLTTQIGEHPGLWGAVLGGVLVGAVVLAVATRARRRAQSALPPDGGAPDGGAATDRPLAHTGGRPAEPRDEE